MDYRKLYLVSITHARSFDFALLKREYSSKELIFYGNNIRECEIIFVHKDDTTLKL
jgi:hypothetical protein